MGARWDEEERRGNGSEDRRSRAGPRNRSGQSRGPGVVPMPKRSTPAATNNHELLAGGMRGKGARTSPLTLKGIVEGPSAPKSLRKSLLSSGGVGGLLGWPGSIVGVDLDHSADCWCPVRHNSKPNLPQWNNTNAYQPPTRLDRRLGIQVWHDWTAARCSRCRTDPLAAQSKQ